MKKQTLNPGSFYVFLGYYDYWAQLEDRRLKRDDRIFVLSKKNLPHGECFVKFVDQYLILHNE